VPTQAEAIYCGAYGPSLSVCVKKYSHIQVFLWFWKSTYVNIQRNEKDNITYSDVFRMCLNDYLLVTLWQNYCFVYASLHMTFLWFSVQTGSGTHPVSYSVGTWSTFPPGQGKEWMELYLYSPVCLNGRYRLMLIMSWAFYHPSLCVHGWHRDNFERTQININ
jgi:hypothetical protein